MKYSLFIRCGKKLDTARELKNLPTAELRAGYGSANFLKIHKGAAAASSRDIKNNHFVIYGQFFEPNNGIIQLKRDTLRRRVVTVSQKCDKGEGDCQTKYHKMSHGEGLKSTKMSHF